MLCQYNSLRGSTLLRIVVIVSRSELCGVSVLASQLNVKVKVKLFPCLTKHHAIKTYWGSGSLAPRILDLGTSGGEWSDSRPSRLTPRESAPRTHWIGGWVGARAVLDAVVKRKIPSPRRERNPRIPIMPF
jgi:hypothetical protein